MAYARTDLDMRDGASQPAIRRISPADLKDALHKGFDDLMVMPSFAVFVVVVYPVIGLLLMWLTFGYERFPLLFPLIAGFPIIAPFAALALYELSRRREQGLPVSWSALDDMSASRVRAALTLGLVLLAVFAAWIATATLLYEYIFAGWVPPSFEAFVHEILTTRAGATLIIVGCGVGLIFALIAFAISAISFPMVLDRDVDAATAMRTSVRAVTENPTTMGLWAIIIAGTLVLASLPFLAGLIVVLPLLGHATWHLYRKVVAPAE